VEPLTERDHLLFEPHEITKADSFYQIYTPFSRRWFEQLAGSVGRERVESQDTVRRQFDSHSKPEKSFELSWAEAAPPGFLRPDQLDSFIAKNAPHVTVPVPEAGFRAAYGRARAFAGKLTRYKDDRDLPGLPGTSRLSIYLKNGSLTVPQLLNELRLEKQGQKDGSGEAQFVRELAWREFYYHILFHRPDVEREPFHARYANLAWENDPALFARWQEGTTGFPIVDAGMRELRETGWMHNRVRMIVASFLTKDLLIDWRWGERHFMRELLDGDLAPNNGGWQWAASTGCDPQPYFRIFNPWLQGEKFDPEGNYIRRFVPELRDVPVKALHSPDASRGRYPTPVVNHALQKAKALQLYKRA